MTNDDFFGGVKPSMKTFDVPEWGRPVTIRMLSTEQVLAATKRKDGDIGLVLDIIAAVCDPETGAAIFTESDIAKISALPFRGAQRINKEIAEFNGFSGDVVAKN